MSLLLSQATIGDPRSPHFGRRTDLFIHNGVIAQMGEITPPEGTRVVDASGMVLFPGFTDPFSHFCDPGLEQKETLESGAAAAAAGGYTRVLLLPNTQPAIHNKSQVEYIVQKSKGLPAQALPLGAITNNCEGKELAEMYDMRQSGAVAFTDGTNPIQNPQIMLKALQYVKAFDGVIIQVPDEQSLSRHGLMHEGIVSTRLGLPGKPAIAEALMLARDLELLRYTQSRLHVTGLSTAASVELVRRAKNDGLNLTCSVTPYHLSFCDEDLVGYDTHLKVNPPLRTRADVEALKSAVLDGTVDCIACHHLPHETDSKVCEFGNAQYGMAGLETCFAAVRTALPQLSPERLANLFSVQPAVIFGLELPQTDAGSKALFTLVDLEAQWQLIIGQQRSVSANYGFANRPLHVKPMAICRDEQFIFYQS
jgi:dihydroorotase